MADLDIERVVDAGDPRVPDAHTVQPVAWLGTCGRCGEPSPEVRDSEEAAMCDAEECPCWADAAADGAWENGQVCR